LVLRRRFAFPFAWMKDNTVLSGSHSIPWVLQPNFGKQSTWRDDNEPRSSSVTRPMLNERHVNMMAFSQCIGIGLFLQSGRVIYLAGPGLGTIAYFLTGTIMWSSAACLGEMAALLPVKGPIFEFPRRFLDESLGYAAGWMTWCDQHLPRHCPRQF
jgi:amino acid permease